MSLPGTANGSKCFEVLLNSELRQQIIMQLLAFASDKPYCATYIAIFAFFAYLPLLGLLVFLVSLMVLLLATLVFWIGVALLVTASFLAMAALLATGVYLYLVAIFLVVRWVRRTLLPGSEDKAQEGKQQARQQQMEAPNIKKEEHSDEESGSGAPARTPEKESRAGTPEDEQDRMKDRMKRDIAKSLQ